MLKIALSLYMGEGDSPLPTLEEMVICNENTTVEEVFVAVTLLLCISCSTAYFMCKIPMFFRWNFYGKEQCLMSQISREFSVLFMQKNCLTKFLIKLPDLLMKSYKPNQVILFVLGCL